jgi:hypothetical protein
MCCRRPTRVKRFDRVELTYRAFERVSVHSQYVLYLLYINYLPSSMLIGFFNSPNIVPHPQRFASSVKFPSIHSVVAET